MDTKLGTKKPLNPEKETKETKPDLSDREKNLST